MGPFGQQSQATKAVAWLREALDGKGNRQPMAIR